MHYKSAFQNKYAISDSIYDNYETMKKRCYEESQKLKQRELLTFEVVRCIFRSPEQFHARVVLL